MWNERDELDDVDKQIIQFLLRQGVVSDEKMKDFAKDIQNEAIRSLDLRDVFERINNRMRYLGMEIRSVNYELDCDNIRKVYHGVVNIDIDDIFTNFGTSLNKNEVVALQEICKHLVSRSLSTDDIEQFISHLKVWKGSQLSAFLLKLEQMAWLQRNSRGFWTLGIRCYLELKGYLEQYLSLDEEELQRFMSNWPQVILY